MKHQITKEDREKGAGKLKGLDKTAEEKRILRLIELFSEGNSRQEAAKICAEEWGITPANVYTRWAKKALERIKDASIAESTNARALMMERLDDIYSKAYKRGDYTNSLKALKQMAELNGLDAPQKQDINITTDAEFEF